MKTILIIRHAKAETSFTLNDFERPLNERGKKDAVEMATRLLKKQIKIDAFISSPAKRAKKTCELFCTEYKQNTEEIIFLSSLYHAPAEIFYEVIEKLDDSLNSIAIFSHNPGITIFANSLVEKTYIDNMPTCSVFAVTISIAKWSGFTKTTKDFLFFDYPKNG